MSKYNYKGIIEAQKKEKIIEEYMCFSSNELVEILIDRDLEIERLNNIINKKEQFLGDNIKRLEREVVKRDNIINEIEKDIKNLYTYGIKNNAEQKDYLLNRLQELKGSGSNE